MDDAVCFKKISQSASAMGWSAANGYLYEQKYKRGKQLYDSNRSITLFRPHH